MKILHIITGLSTGGAERALYNLLAGGLSESSDVTVLSLRDEGTYGPLIRELGVPVYTLGMRRGIPDPVAIARLRSLVKVLQPEIIQGWMYHGNLAASLTGWLAPNRTMVAWNIRHSLYSLTDEKPLTRHVIRANRWLSGRADAIVYNSSLSRHQHEAFGFDAVRGRVIPNGFDVETFRPDQAIRESTRSVLMIPEDALLVGHVARFHPMKDHVRFMRVAVRVAVGRADVHFLLVGHDVTTQNKLLTSLVPKEVKERFHMLGERYDIPELMQAMDVLASSSWSEAFPNVLGEAMACGIPCVTTDVGDSALIVDDTGSVVPSRDDDALFKGLMDMLNKTPEERRGLGCAARARVVENYALSQIVAQYAAMFETIKRECQ